MKVEYLPNGSDDCPLIRIYGTIPEQFGTLLDAVRNLSVTFGSTEQICKLPGFQSLLGCSLTIVSSYEDFGVDQCEAPRTFVWTQTPKIWRSVADLVLPFVEEPAPNIFQWLAGNEARFGLDASRIAILLSFSDDGRW